MRVLPDTVVTRLLQHDSAPALSSCAAREGLLDVTRTLLIGLAAPPYSPNLSTCAFFLFPRVKYRLRGYHFETVDGIQRTVTDDALKKLTEDFQ